MGGSVILYDWNGSPASVISSTLASLKLLIVEGNTKEENINFNNAGCLPQSQNFKKHIQKIIFCLMFELKFKLFKG